MKLLFTFTIYCWRYLPRHKILEPVGLFTGNSTLLVENDTVTGSAVRAISKWNAISAESLSGSVSTMSVKNSAATNPIAATFIGNVI